MLQLPTGQLILVLVQATLLLGLIARLWSAGLYREYPYFFSYLLADLLQSVILSFIPFKGAAYPYFWLVTEAIIVCFFVLIIGELYRVVFREFPGIASISRRYITVTIALAILVSLLLLRVEQAPAGLVSTFFVFERAIVFSLVLFILLVTTFLVYYPVPLNRNVVVYSIGYAVYFLTKATGLLIRTLGHYVMPQIATVLLIVASACLLFWLLGLNRRGEQRTVVIGHKWKAEDEQRLLAKLEAINANLLSMAKK
jgi:hypothetical protein